MGWVGDDYICLNHACVGTVGHTVGLAHTHTHIHRHIHPHALRFIEREGLFEILEEGQTEEARLLEK